MSADLAINARYAGLFGRIGETARIRNLIVKAECAVGYEDTKDHTKSTIYAGILAAYAKGGNYENVVVVMEKTASLCGSVSTGRVFGFLETDDDVAESCWVICYNSKENYELNESEILFNDPEEKGGANQGGFNTMMVVGAGTLSVTWKGAPEEDKSPIFFSFDKNAGVHWYKLNEFDEECKAADICGTIGDGTFTPDVDALRYGYNVSFLKSEIASLADLKTYADNINKGYDFYNLTFKLTANLTIDTKWDDPTDNKNDLVPYNFAPIGTPESGLNGTLDGQDHTITIKEGVAITGTKYAGLFGYVAEDGIISNLRVVAECDFGDTNTTQYAGVVAYNNGKLENLIVIPKKTASLNTISKVSSMTSAQEPAAGIAVGYDKTNLVTNVWALVDASSYLPTVGRSAAGDTGVNTMKIIGIGEVDAIFADGKVKFTTPNSDAAIPVMGWYKSFEKNNQISEAMLSGKDSLQNGKGGYLIAPTELFGVTYEVAVIDTDT